LNWKAWKDDAAEDGWDSEVGEEGGEPESTSAGVSPSLFFRSLLAPFDVRYVVAILSPFFAA